MYRIISIALLIFTGCQKLKPEVIDVSAYPDLEQLAAMQAKNLAGTRVEKTVMLGEETETKRFTYDSAQWAEELSFLDEINPNQPQYVGAFEESTDASGDVQLILAEGEKGELKQITYSKAGENFRRIVASFHEDRDVYVHHRNVSVQFSNGQIEKYQIEGYQKMLFKDTVKFAIRGRVEN